VRPGEQPLGEQRERREDADELPEQELDRDPQEAAADEQQAGDRLQGRDDHDRDVTGAAAPTAGAGATRRARRRAR
jgi:hypothetical protein